MNNDIVAIINIWAINSSSSFEALFSSFFISIVLMSLKLVYFTLYKHATAQSQI